MMLDVMYDVCCFLVCLPVFVSRASPIFSTFPTAFFSQGAVLKSLSHVCHWISTRRPYVT